MKFLRNSHPTNTRLFCFQTHCDIHPKIEKIFLNRHFFSVWPESTNSSSNVKNFLRCFRDPNRVPRIENLVPRIRTSYHRVSRIRENVVPRIREIGSLQVHTGYLTFSLKKHWYNHKMFVCFPLFKVYMNILRYSQVLPPMSFCFLLVLSVVVSLKGGIKSSALDSDHRDCRMTEANVGYTRNILEQSCFCQSFANCLFMIDRLFLSHHVNLENDPRSNMRKVQLWHACLNNFLRDLWLRYCISSFYNRIRNDFYHIFKPIKSDIIVMYLILLCSTRQGRVHGKGWFGRHLPLKPTNVTFFTMIL